MQNAKKKKKKDWEILHAFQGKVLGVMLSYVNICKSEGPLILNSPFSPELSVSL